MTSMPNAGIARPSPFEQHEPSRPLISRLTLVCDLLLIAGSSLLSTFLYFGHPVFTPAEAMATVIGLLIAAQLLPCFRLYDEHRLSKLADRMPRLLTAWAMTIVLMLAVLYVTKISEDLSRLWLGYWFVTVSLALAGSRLLLHSWIDSAQRAGRLAERIVVVGQAPLTDTCLSALGRQNSSIKIVGHLNIGEPTLPSDCSGQSFLDFDDLERFLLRGGADQVLLALPWRDPGPIQKAIRRVRHLPVEVALYPDLEPLACEAAAFKHVGDVKVVKVLARPLNEWGLFMKGIQDRIIATVALILAAPVMVLTACAIKLTSEGPVLFRQKRYGLNQEIIEVYKFRSMYVDQCDGAALSRSFRQAERNDPRMTPVGRFIRRTSIDELPQLFNVLKGEMSIVGPRPHPLPLDEAFRAKIQDYVLRHRVKPGMTGWAQVNGYRGQTENEHKMRSRVQHDVFYANNWSLALDMIIILRTPISLLFNRSVY